MSEVAGAVAEARTEIPTELGFKLQHGDFIMEIGPFKDTRYGRVRLTLGILKWNRTVSKMCAKEGVEFPADAPKRLSDVEWKKIWEG